MAGPARGPGSLTGTKDKRSRPLRVLILEMFKHMGQFKKIILIAAILSIIATIFMAIDPLILSWGIDLVLEPGSEFSSILVLGRKRLFQY